MAKKDTRYPKGYYDNNPGELPESLQILEGHDFHAVTKMREAGNQNRTTLVELRPKHLKALVEKIEDSARLAAKARGKKTAEALKRKSTELKQARAATSAAEAELEDLESTLEAVVAERDAALEKIRAFGKQSRRPSDEAKELKILKGVHEMLKSRADEQRLAYVRLDERFRQLQGENERSSVDLRKAEKTIEQMTNDLKVAEAVLLTKGIRLYEVAESSGIKTSSTVLSDSVVKTTGGKPLPGSNPG